MLRSKWVLFPSGLANRVPNGPIRAVTAPHKHLNAIALETDRLRAIHVGDRMLDNGSPLTMQSRELFAPWIQKRTLRSKTPPHHGDHYSLGWRCDIEQYYRQEREEMPSCSSPPALLAGRPEPKCLRSWISSAIGRFDNARLRSFAQS
jgi:hypothetical protein